MLALIAALLFQPFNPSLPVFGSGALTNLSLQCDGCMTNASAHVAWALAIPLAGRTVGGRKGMLIAGSVWIGASLLLEAFFHAPKHWGSDYPAEVRTDLLTRILPTLALFPF